jgi:cation diffusion facilitator family transporter
MKSRNRNIQTKPLIRFAWLSVAAAVFTIALKSIAYQLTGSVGLLSDALESIVNLIGALMALAMLTIAARPADEDHAFGHNKAEFFSSGVEGTLILVAAVSIGVTAIQRLITPKPIEQIGLGIGISIVASIVNLSVARVLLRASKRYRSITLEANSQHLMTDVWTSVGVLAGVGAVALTGWEGLDPVVALVVAGNIIWSGVQIVRKSVSGLMDTSLSTEEQSVIQSVLDEYGQSGVEFHALRTRQAGTRSFVSFHVLVPGEWTVQRGHDLLERIENDLCAELSYITVFTHLESIDDPRSWNDTSLERTGLMSSSGESRDQPKSSEDDDISRHE